MEVGDSVDDMLSRRQHAPAFEDARESEDEVKTLMEISRKLCLVEDPPSEPFRSKYKAREALLKARQSLVGLLGQQDGGAGGAEEVCGDSVVCVLLLWFSVCRRCGSSAACTTVSTTDCCLLRSLHKVIKDMDAL